MRNLKYPAAYFRFLNKDCMLKSPLDDQIALTLLEVSKIPMITFHALQHLKPPEIFPINFDGDVFVIWLAQNICAIER